MSRSILQNKLENASQSDRMIVKSFLESPQEVKESVKSFLESPQEVKESVKSFLESPQEVKESVKSFLQTSKQNPKLISIFARVSATKKLNAIVESNQGSDFDTLLEFLNDPDFLADATKTDPLAAAKLKGAKFKHDLLKGTLSSEEIAKLLGISRQAVDKRRHNGKLLAFSQGRRGYAYPSWQVENGQVTAGLDQVLQVLSEYSEWTQAMFLTTGDLHLHGQTPLECLRLGKTQEVLTAAKIYGEQSAA